MEQVNKKINVKESESIDIDVTPMLNVLYMLLFFFVIGGQLGKEVSIHLNKAPLHPSQNTLTIVVEVSNNGDIHIQKRYVAPRAVTATINRLKSHNVDGPVIVKVDRRAKTKFLVSTIDDIRKANVLLPAIYII